MQYSSRINITVKNVEVWKRLFDMDLEPYWINGTAEEVFDINSLSFVIDGDWGCPERELGSFVYEISERLGEDALIIADNCCLSVDPYTFFAYSFGDGVSTELFIIDDEEEYDADEDDPWGNGTMWGMHDNTDINNIADTISYGKCFRFSEKELEVLKSFGIEQTITESGPEYTESVKFVVSV